MSRKWLFRIVVAIFGIMFFFLLWSFAYELVVAFRWKATIPGDGSARFDLLKSQNSSHDLLIAWKHFYSRLLYPPTQTETLFRGAIAAGAVIGLAIVAVITALIARPPRPYGDARFGTISDAERNELLSKKGLFLGRLNGRMIISDDPSHVLVVGPTRSGKGVSFVIPNGLMWQGSSVWLDPKRENYDAIAAYRKSIGDKIFVFSPGERNSHRYNPLDFIRRDERMPTDCTVVASFIVPEGSGSSATWSTAGRQLLQTLIGYVISSRQFEGKRHLRSVAVLLSSGTDLKTLLQSIVKNEQSDIPVWVSQGMNQFIALEPETRTSALFNTNLALNPWTSDLIAAVTATSDFDLRNLRRERMAIFITCSVAQLDVYRPLIKIFVQQLHDLLMSSMPDNDEPYQVLMMLDEFRQLGRMDSIVSKLAINLGYGFRMVLILQDLSQLDELYGVATRNSTIAACQLRLFIRINDLESSKYVSQMLGTTTQEIRTPIIRANQGIFGARDKSISYQERPFRTPQELRGMSTKYAILLIPNAPGFQITRAISYQDAKFKPALQKFKGLPVPIPQLDKWTDASPSTARQPALQTVEKLEPRNSSPPNIEPAAPSPPIDKIEAPKKLVEVQNAKKVNLEAEDNSNSDFKPKIFEATEEGEEQDDGSPLTPATDESEMTPSTVTPIAIVKKSKTISIDAAIKATTELQKEVIGDLAYLENAPQLGVILPLMEEFGTTKNV